MTVRVRGILASLALLLALAGVIVGGLRWYRIAATNALIEAHKPLAIDASDAPAARFAKAYWLSGKAPRKAIGIYGDLVASTEGRLGLAARYNLANLHLGLAIKAVSEDRAKAAMSQILQARAQYRRALYLQPDHHAAKYNLEYLARLLQTRRAVIQQQETKVGNKPPKRDPSTGWKAIHKLPRGLP